MIEGFADYAATKEYLKKHEMINAKGTPWFYGSPIAVGTHLGNMNEEDSLKYQDSLRYALNNGVNFIDTAINYRGMRSERDIGIVLNEMIIQHQLRREEIILSTKAGIIPGDIDAGLVPIDYLEKLLLKPGVICTNDIQIHGHQKHVLSPSYYAFAINKSRGHMNVSTLDIHYIHNPELSKITLGETDFYLKLQDLFDFYESAVDKGLIRFYGMAVWEAFTLDCTASGYISLERTVQTARSVAGDTHHFRFIQLPYHLNNTASRIRLNQKVDGEWLSPIDAASKLKLYVTTSAPLNHGKLACDLESALSYVIETQGIFSVMLGMKTIDHVKENLNLLSKNLTN